MRRLTPTFFTTRETAARLTDGRASTIFLLGSFAGYWNLGDVLQLRGALRWHRAHGRADVACTLVELKTVRDADDLRPLRALFGTEAWFLYASDEDAEAAEAARRLALEPVSLADVRSPAVVHAYGGGYFNRLWGSGMLGLLEALLRGLAIERYVMSGQQVGREFAAALGAHCRDYRPEIVGCRDEESADALREVGVAATVSGDDAFEELMACRVPPGDLEAAGDPRAAFGLHLNLSSYVYAHSERGGRHQERVVLDELANHFRLLRAHFPSSVRPLIAAAYLDARPEIHDTWTGIKKTGFTCYFPRFAAVDLTALLLDGRLTEAVAALRRTSAFLSMSYHVALLTKILGVPTFLMAFNEYYRQKKRALGEGVRSLRDFLEASPTQILGEQEEYLSAQADIRQRWLARQRAIVTGRPEGHRTEAPVLPDVANWPGSEPEAVTAAVALPRPGGMEFGPPCHEEARVPGHRQPAVDWRRLAEERERALRDQETSLQSLEHEKARLEREKARLEEGERYWRRVADERGARLRKVEAVIVTLRLRPLIRVLRRLRALAGRLPGVGAADR